MEGKNKAGGGASTTAHGKQFEDSHSLEKVLVENGYTVEKGSVYLKGKYVGMIASQGNFYKLFLKKTMKTVRETIGGKALKPDTAFYNANNKTLYIIEKKFQKSKGSVDEKIQTCEYKLRFYNRVAWKFKEEEVKHVRYFYLLSDFFKEKEYKESLHFIQDTGCDFYFDKIELHSIGL